MTENTESRIATAKQKATILFWTKIPEVAEFAKEFAFAFAASQTENELLNQPVIEWWRDKARGILYFAEQVSLLSTGPVNK